MLKPHCTDMINLAFPPIPICTAVINRVSSSYFLLSTSYSLYETNLEPMY